MNTKKTESSQDDTREFTALDGDNYLALLDDYDSDAEVNSAVPETDLFDIPETLPDEDESEIAAIELLEGDSAPSGKHDFQLDADLSTVELSEEDELYPNNSELPDELTFEEMIDTGLETDDFSSLLSEDSVAPDVVSDKTDYELNNAFQTDEITEAEAQETDNSEPSDNLTFEELIDTGITIDSSLTQSTDDLALSVGNDFESESEGESESQSEDFFLDPTPREDEPDVTLGEWSGELTFEELIATDSDTNTDLQHSSNDGFSFSENEFVPPKPEYPPVEKKFLDQNVSITDTAIDNNTARKIIPARDLADKKEVCDELQSKEELPVTNPPDAVSGSTKITKPEKNIAANPFVSTANKTQQIDNWLKKSITIVVLVLVLGVAGFWCGYTRIDNDNNNDNDKNPQLRDQLQNRQQSQSNVPLLAGDVTKDAAHSVTTPLKKLKEQLDVQSEKTSREFQQFSEATSQLEKRLTTVEEIPIAYGGKDQIAQVAELAQQLKYLERLVHGSITENQDMAVEVTHQLNQLDTSINQLEKRVIRKEVPQKYGQEAIHSAEAFVPEIARNVASIENNAIVIKKTSGNAVVNSAAGGEALSHIGSVESTSHKTFSPIAMEGFPEDQNWSVNLASFKELKPAEREQNRLNGIGIEATIRKALVLGAIRYRVRIEGFPSTMKAREFIQVQLDQNIIENAWVSATYF